MERDLKFTLKEGKFLNVSKKTSRVMRSIKSRGNKTTELTLRMELVRQKIKGWQLHPNNIQGSPDFIFPKNKLLIFVDGCYWHGCQKCGHIPKTNTKFWEMKIGKNIKRDKKNNKQLKNNGYLVLRFWEHDLRNRLDYCINSIKKNLNK